MQRFKGGGGFECKRVVSYAIYIPDMSYFGPKYYLSKPDKVSVFSCNYN